MKNCIIFVLHEKFSAASIYDFAMNVIFQIFNDAKLPSQIRLLDP